MLEDTGALPFVAAPQISNHPGESAWTPQSSFGSSTGSVDFPWATQYSQDTATTVDVPCVTQYSQDSVHSGNYLGTLRVADHDPEQPLGLDLTANPAQDLGSDLDASTAGNRSTTTGYTPEAAAFGSGTVHRTTHTGREAAAFGSGMVHKATHTGIDDDDAGGTVTIEASRRTTTFEFPELGPESGLGLEPANKPELVPVVASAVGLGSERVCGTAFAADADAVEAGATRLGKRGATHYEYQDTAAGVLATAVDARRSSPARGSRAHGPRATSRLQQRATPAWPDVMIIGHDRG